MAVNRYITESDIPFEKAFLMTDRFILLNMASDGIWYVDKHHSEWAKIKETALNIAKTYKDAETILKLME